MAVVIEQRKRSLRGAAGLHAAVSWLRVPVRAEEPRHRALTTNCALSVATASGWWPICGMQAADLKPKCRWTPESRIQSSDARPCGLTH